MRFLRQHHRTDDHEDSVPEESDALVGVLREAYASTPVPDDLLWRVGAAVRAAEVDIREPKRPNRRPKVALILAPMMAALLVVGGIVIGRNLDQGTKRASPNSFEALPSLPSATAEMFTNQAGLDVKADAAFVPSGDVIRVSYKVGLDNFAKNHARIHAPAQHVAKDGRKQVLLDVGVGPRIMFKAFLGGRVLPVVGCGSATAVRDEDLNVVCYRDTAPIALRLASGRALKTMAPANVPSDIVLIANDEARFGLKRTAYGSVPSHRPESTVPGLYELSKASTWSSCQISHRYLCLAMSLPIQVSQDTQAGSGAPNSGRIDKAHGAR